MGTKVTIGSTPSVEAISLSTSESASPLTAGDSSGGTGSFTLVIARSKLSEGLTLNNVPNLVARIFPARLVDEYVIIQDDVHGVLTGVILGVSESEDSQTITLTGTSLLGRLDVHNIQALPFSGTLANAVDYYAGLAQTGLETLISVDPSIATLQVNYPGWQGDLWFHLKQMAMTLDAEIALVSGTILIRPIRTRTILDEFATSRSRTASKGTLAQRVEVYLYNNVAVEDELIYPPGGWSPEVSVLNVNAGEIAEYTLELSSSLKSIISPVMDTVVTQDESHRSVYTVVANDGLPVPPALWNDRGGLVEISIAPDTKSLLVRLRGAANIPLSTGGAATSFSLALASDTGGSRYSTLRIVGTGVSFSKELISIRTGVTPLQTGTEVGATVDNPFVSTREEATRIGLRLASAYGGATLALSSTLTRAYSRQSGIETFGNVAGARIFDERTNRWYRVREATIDRSQIPVSGDDDLTIGDALTHYAGMTYAQVADHITGTYEQLQVEGLT